MTLHGYPSVICWDTASAAEARGLGRSDHDKMVAVGVVASLIPLAFLALTFWVVWRTPSKLASGAGSCPQGVATAPSVQYVLG